MGSTQWHFLKMAPQSAFVSLLSNLIKFSIVTVDDRIPCSSADKCPLFARSSDPCELWPALIEKAYAKLHHSYEVNTGFKLLLTKIGVVFWPS